MTDIMRICPHDPTVGFYLLAYLLTDTAQALIRRGRTGTTVDHLASAELLEIPVVWPAEEIRDEVSGLMRDAEGLLDRARIRLDDIERELHRISGLPFIPNQANYISEKVRAFSMAAGSIFSRVDAAYYDPSIRVSADALKDAGAAYLSDLADLRMLGRYKRYYVDRAFGRPILSGRQLLQLRPVALKYISDRSFSDPENFVIREGWSLFTCDGRSEEALESTAFVPSIWDGWMASNHVMRAIPRDGVSPGYLYLALRSPYTQLQLKGRATGSVVDALDPETISSVLVPQLSSTDATRLGEQAEAAWTDISTYQVTCLRALEIVNSLFGAS